MVGDAFLRPKIALFHIKENARQNNGSEVLTVVKFDRPQSNGDGPDLSSFLATTFVSS